MQIARARPADADALTRIAVSAKNHWGYPERWMEIWIPQLTVSSAYILENETWIGMAEREPVAFYALKQEDDSLWLDHLWVLPDWMGQGIGGQLFRHACERGRARGASVLRIESDLHAQGFYEKMGAVKVDERRGETDGQARVLPVMEIHL